MFIFCLMLSFMLFTGVLLYYINELGFKPLPFGLFVIGLILNVYAVVFSINYGKDIGKDIGRAQEMVESGRYEIATHNDYSLNELNEFIYINGVYLKEVE